MTHIKKQETLNYKPRIGYINRYVKLTPNEIDVLLENMNYQKYYKQPLWNKFLIRLFSKVQILSRNNVSTTTRKIRADFAILK